MESIYRAYKVELNPNNKQRTIFMRCAGAARYVYNWGLDDRKAMYDAGTPTTCFTQIKKFNSIKDELCPWIREIPYIVTESAFRNLDAAFQNFFRRVRNGEKPGYPKKKSRSKGIGSFTFRANVHIEEKRIKLPIIGWIRLKQAAYLPVGIKPNTATVSERAGHWYVSVMIEEEKPKHRRPKMGPIGVDPGIKSMAVCSDGTVFENPNALRKQATKLRRLSRKLSRQQKGGKNRKKTIREIQRVYLKATNIRIHAQHSVSRYTTSKRRPNSIGIETLNVSGMLKNHHMARSVSDVGFSEILGQIKYKADWLGIPVPSSKTCSNCGAIKSDLTLADRVYECPECGMVMDRDLNAAKNLAALAH